MFLYLQEGGMESELPSFPSVSGGSKLGIIILSDGSKMEGFSGESMSDNTPFMNTS